MNQRYLTWQVPLQKMTVRDALTTTNVLYRVTIDNWIRKAFEVINSGILGCYPISTDGLKRAKNFKSCRATLRRIRGV